MHQAAVAMGGISMQSGAADAATDFTPSYLKPPAPRNLADPEPHHLRSMRARPTNRMRMEYRNIYHGAYVTSQPLAHLLIWTLHVS